MNKTNPAIDELLVLNAQRGDTKAMSQLAKRWSPHLLKICSSRLRSSQQAADAVQETWIKAIKQLGQLRDPSRFPGWITRIAIHQSINLIRSAQKDRQVLRELEHFSEADSEQIQAEPEFDAQQLKQALGQLTKRHRQLIVMHYLKELSVAQIARELLIPEGTVKSGLFHAREHLKKGLTQQNSLNKKRRRQ